MFAGQFPHDEAGDLDLGRLHILAIDPGVADQGSGHHQNLPRVRGIGEGLLVAGHGGVEDDLGGLG